MLLQSGTVYSPNLFVIVDYNHFKVCHELDCLYFRLLSKLVKLRRGVALVRPEDRKAVENIYSDKISQWRKRKRMFKELWDAITENSDLKEFKEALGIENDEDLGVILHSFSDLLQHGKKRARGQ
ncbi:LOW QUALITY PROTEIN: hypothetical protein CFOL_v3_20102 [Cephalotus follicularis]|uniref:Leucine zipper with capping helix domain-containing protein n=1 Tax=Cephalotus follicularis TaxID=3775 RepID=A0A1Q3C8T5_CEPFO|nr:LOW QUALITY PROTEIN: hypothetical protein CFOL_v3_20102 [Cephalotus follicularis]